jgi:hypothetical protein
MIKSDSKNQASLLTVSLILGIILSIRSLTKTREQEQLLEVRITKIDERLKALESE